MTAPFWFLAWVGFSILFGLLVAEIWIRLRDGADRPGIDLDTEDARHRPNPPHVSEEIAAAMTEIRREPLTDEDAREMQQALTRLARKQGRHTP